MSDFVCPEGARLIPLGSRKWPGHFAIVDAEDYPTLSQYHWTVREQGRHTKVRYAYRNPTPAERAAGRISPIWLHRAVMGDIGDLHVDHINHDGLDNRRSNLRAVTHAQNMANKRPPARYLPATRYGVSLISRGREGGRRYVAEIWLLGRRVATFKSKSREAARLWKIEMELIKSAVLSSFV